MRGARFAAALLLVGSSVAQSQGTSLRFFGNGVGDIDRVKFPVGAVSGLPTNVSGSFTLEFWMKPAAGNGGSVSTGNDGWITGNIVWDRDVYGNGDFGDWGVSWGGTRLAFGVGIGAGGNTIVTSVGALPEGVWKHVAVTRNVTTGALAIWVDGALAASGSGPTGNIAYNVGRPTAWPNDPHLVLGAEKHDAGAAYPSFHGFVDDARLSSGVRYAAPFAKPTAPHPVDGTTLALWRFDEGAGTTAGDAVGGAGSTVKGTLFVGGTPTGPLWSTDTPFGAAPLSLHTVAPCRVFDTRSPIGPYGGPALAASASRTFALAGVCGIPATARAVSLNLTATGATVGGYLTLHPAGTPLPATSTLNVLAGPTRANNAVVRVSSDGTASLAVFAGLSAGSVHAILDVNGWFE